MSESRFADEGTLAHIAQLEAENAKLREELAPVLEAQNQEPFPFSAERVTYHKAAPVVQTDRATKEYIVQLECAVENLRSNLAAAKRVQPDVVLVPREPTEAMLAVIRNERGAYGTGEALYADLIAAAEGKK